MHGIPDRSKEEPVLPSVSVALPSAFVLKDPIPDELAALGREVLEMVPRKLRDSLEAYRQAASDLSRMLRATGVRVKPNALYYAALRLKWIKENTTV